MPILRNNIANAEGCKLSAYRDSVGVWTIGYGHTPAKEGQICTPAQADAWLDADIEQARALAARLPEAKDLDPVRLDTLTELVFNLGPAKWKLFIKTRAAISDREWQTAHDALLASKWAWQVQPKGFDVPGRATRLANQLLTGSYDV